jgi:hypothetical protein
MRILYLQVSVSATQMTYLSHLKIADSHLIEQNKGHAPNA